MFAHPPPPGMMFAFSPPQNATAPVPQSSPAAAAAATATAIMRQKRKQVKMACTNCAAACKRCDEQRPCERCRKYGIMDTCVDGQRKERKKGIKRGPYKRRNRVTDDNNAQFPEGASSEGGEWPPGTAPPPTALQTVAAQFPNGEAFYHPTIYYPPPGPGPFLAGPLPPPHSQDGNDGSSSQASGQPSPHISYYIHGAYPPPFSHYPPFLHAPPPNQAASAPIPAPTVIDPAMTNTSGNGDARTASTTADTSDIPPIHEKSSKKKKTREENGGGAKAKKGKGNMKGVPKGDTEVIPPTVEEAEVDRIVVIAEPSIEAETRAEPDTDADPDAEGEAGDGEGEEDR